MDENVSQLVEYALAIERIRAYILHFVFIFQNNN
jgi:hypothetical protein